MDIAIKTAGLTKQFGSLTAVNEVDLEVFQGEVFSFLGPNGAGKTTTIRMLSCLTKPSKGEATVAGYNVVKDPVAVKQNIGVVPETSNLYDELTVWDNLQFVSQLYHVPKKERSERINQLLKTFNIMERRESKFGKLSKGFKRRVVIAAALVHNPKIVFLDEPTSGLDVMSSISLRMLIRKLGEGGTTVFLTTHYIEEADQLSDRVGVIVNGIIMEVDTPENIKRKYAGKDSLDIHFSREPDKNFIQKLERVLDLQVEGKSVRIESPSIIFTLKTVAEISSEHGIEIAEINTSKPSLEEAFMELTGIQPEIMQIDKERRGS